MKISETESVNVKGIFDLEPLEVNIGGDIMAIFEVNKIKPERAQMIIECMLLFFAEQHGLLPKVKYEVLDDLTFAVKH